MPTCMSASPRSSRSSTIPSPRPASTRCASALRRWAGPPPRSSPSTPTRAIPVPAPATGKGSSTGSPRSAWAGPGIVLGLEVSRLARNNADWYRLLEICALTSTLICDEDGLYDPGEFNDRVQHLPETHTVRKGDLAPQNAPRTDLLPPARNARSHRRRPYFRKLTQSVNVPSRDSDHQATAAAGASADASPSTTTPQRPKTPSCSE